MKGIQEALVVCTTLEESGPAFNVQLTERDDPPLPLKTRIPVKVYPMGGKTVASTEEIPGSVVELRARGPFWN